MANDAASDSPVPSPEQSITVLRQLVASWDQHEDTEIPILEDGDWERGLSIRVQVEHAVRLTRAILTLAEAGLRIEMVPLVRFTMECSVMAAWLATTEGSGKAASYHASKEYSDLYNALLRIDGAPATDPHSAAIKNELAALQAYGSEEARNFRARCEAVDGGVWIYAYYKLFSKLSHGRLGLNDEYLQQVPHSPEARLGLAFKDPGSFALWPVVLGFQVTMLYNAMVVWDRISKPHPRNAVLEAAQLAQIAEALGRDIRGLDTRAAAVAGVEAIDEIIAAIELPPTLQDLGVQEGDLAQIAKLSLNSKRLIDNNPVPLDLDAVTSIVSAAYAGDRTIR